MENTHVMSGYARQANFWLG